MNLEQFSVSAASLFASKYENITSEKQFAQSFWRDLFQDVCGIKDLLAVGIEFEFPVRFFENNNVHFIDVLWPGILLVEHKSTGFDLDKAERQARDYLISLEISKRPPIIIVSDFANIRIINVLGGTSTQFLLSELPAHINRFESIIGDAGVAATWSEASADSEAANLMSQLFITFEKAGYTGHEVSVLLVRILFLLFGDDTTMWRRTEKGLFRDVVEISAADGSGLGAILQDLFRVLNCPQEHRSKTISKSLSEFPYVNGGLFSEEISTFDFNSSMREALLSAASYDWSQISPAIFGSLFQSVRDPETRRKMGEHYTSETVILRCINDLFLNDFNERMNSCWDEPVKLKTLHAELGDYTWLDPACGSGNFLVVAYKRMREIELRLIARLQTLGNKRHQLSTDGTYGLKIRLGQFHGIEIDEWSASIARVAMFLADHQANISLASLTGAAPNRFPLTESANIVTASALKIEWREVCALDNKTFILGNPPFNGARWQSSIQKKETQRIWEGVRGSGEMDYVSNWFLLAGKCASYFGCRVGFVSTNSIAQGEQASILWSQLLPLSVKIDFAHRSFTWTNGTTGQASVTVVIVGFSTKSMRPKAILWSYRTTKSQPSRTEVENINPYLLSASNILITGRRQPLIADIPILENGNMPNDGGHLSNLSEDEVEKIRNSDPIASKYLRRLVGARELIHDEIRFCLWLTNAEPNEIRNSNELSRRVGLVRELRLASRRMATRKLANKPNEFGEIRQPKVRVTVVPRITSELRDYVPISVVEPSIILNDKVSFVIDQSLVMFAWLSSRPFNVWNKAVSGRTRNDTLISNSITFNNFPFLELTRDQKLSLGSLSEGVLAARDAHPGNVLADLYGAESMPFNLRAAHSKVDKQILDFYGVDEDASDSQILAVLFTRYEKLVSKSTN